ncbi:Mbeg1-like protein [Sphingomonas sp. RB3P16]|uniref:Mbeg1-like protein n=1 Tax=Parasphingomonas frigoris TaxID=3096163 RepID=UPI002FCA38F8
MLQSVTAAQAIRPTSVSGTAPDDPPGASYLRDWRSGPATLPPALLRAPPPTAANDTGLATRARENALLSADVYRATPTPPPGFHVADAAALDKLGLTPTMLEQPGSSFRARVYVAGDGADQRYVVAFRGSQDGEDWKNNAEQALGLNSVAYGKALQIGRVLARSDAAVTLTGHSLGGGLASAAAIAAGRDADTFNAAGLTDKTIASARSAGPATAAQVQAYHVPGEILTTLQQGGDRALAGVVFGPLGAALGDLPEAYGVEHTLPNVRPAGASFVDGLNPVARHGMDWVLAGTGALRD